MLNTDLHIRVSEDEKKILKDYAKGTRHKKISAFFKYITNEYVALGKNGFELLDNLANLRREINAIGTNLNQIAKRLNSDNSEIISIEEEIKTIREINNKITSQINKIKPLKYDMTKRKAQQEEQKRQKSLNREKGNDN